LAPWSENLKQLLFILFFSFSISAYSNDPLLTHKEVQLDPPKSTTDLGAKFIKKETYSFSAAIDPATLVLVPEKRIDLYNSFHSTFEKTYSIANLEQLETFNQKVSEREKISLDNFKIYTYFLIYAPACQDYFEYTNHTYDAGRLMIILNRFTRPNVYCAAVLVQSYDVFRAKK
jgi:hypothetical protein